MDKFMTDYDHNVPFNESQIHRYVRYSNITLENIHLRYKSFKECTFSGLSFIGCTFTDCLFTGCMVLAAKFEKCVFTRCSFDASFTSYTSLTNCRALECRIVNCAFHHTYFSESAFLEDNYFHCSFNSCDETDCWRMHCYAVECFGLSKTCPEVGSFIGWKRLSNDVIAKLEIPAYAHRTSGFSRKCRADCALALDFYHTDGTEWPEVDNVPSIYDKKFIYTRGKIAYADSFGEGRKPCGHGIHFYLSFHEAVEYGQP